MLSNKERLSQLDALLLQTAHLWRPQPYKQRRPAWCKEQPELSQRLLELDEAELRRLTADQGSLIELLSHYFPSLAALPSLTQLPDLENVQLRDVGDRFAAGIPGRKWSQIRAFVSAVGKVSLPVIEWCGGKGHLGRLLSAQWQQPVETLELQETLCLQGEQMAKRVGVVQHFTAVDVLAQPPAPLMPESHAVALHACGGLHRRLLRRTVDEALPALDIAPCCYHLHGEECYVPLSDGLQLQLSRDDVRIAVTETVTAVEREVRLRDTEMAWKLAFDLLRQQLGGNDAYRPIKPIDKQWLNLGFEDFCRRLAAREGLKVDSVTSWMEVEAQGWQRQHDVMRLSLLRHAFRRAIELWLVLDMTLFLEAHGYAVNLGTFCKQSLTPRNILIRARKR